MRYVLSLAHKIDSHLITAKLSMVLWELEPRIGDEVTRLLSDRDCYSRVTL